VGSPSSAVSLPVFVCGTRGGRGVRERMRGNAKEGGRERECVRTCVGMCLCGGVGMARKALRKALLDLMCWCVCVRVYAFVRMCMCVRTRVCMCARAHTRVCVSVRDNKRDRVCVHECMCAGACV